jgi:hypothetical protein
LEQHVWAWIPEDTGLVYITLRFDFPPNLNLTSRPTFHELLTELVVSEYSDGTTEWNMLFVECPSGWLEIFTRTCVIIDRHPAVIRIAGEHSMVRDCGFILNDIEVLSDLRINDSECDQISSRGVTWGGMKELFR